MQHRSVPISEIREKGSLAASDYLPRPTPPGIDRLPVDVRRKLPVPYMNQRDDGSHDFLAIYAPHVVRCLAENLCGICGERLSFASAFVGGPLSAQNRIYNDPAFHPHCAEFAMEVCPHIVIPHAKRATDARLARESGPVVTPEAAVMDKPQEWIVGIAPTRETRWRIADGLYVHPGPFTKRLTYRYNNEGKLVRA